MTKYFFTVVGLLLFSQNLVAQNQLEIGVKGGLNIAGLTLSNDGKIVGVIYNVRQGYHVGVFAQIRRKKFALQPELLFSNQGQNFTTPNYSNLDIQLNYISVPVVLKYYVVGGLYVQAGPQLGILASANGSLVQLNGGYLGIATQSDLKKYVHEFDWSFAVGAGIDLPFGGNLSIRYSEGISDVNKFSRASLPNSLTPSINTAFARNQVLQLTLGCRFKKFKIGK